MVTIKDIALEANVSIGTVSRAINGKAGMRPEVRERILSIARRIDYHPNFQARGLVANRPNAIGIVIPQTVEFALSNPYYSEILKGIEGKAREIGQYLVCSISRGESYDHIYQNRLAAGIIIIANRMNDCRVNELYCKKVPLVLIPGDPNAKHIPSVDRDNVDGALQAITHLITMGHRRIAFINGPKDSRYSVDGFLGYKKAMEKYQVPIHQEFIQESDFSQKGGYENMKKLLVMKNPPTAVLMINDWSAVGSLQAAKDMGYRVPEDVSIIGSGDTPYASTVDPPLTTIHTPYYTQGEKAVEMLMKIIRGKKPSPKHIILPVSLVVRKSTSPPARSG